MGQTTHEIEAHIQDTRENLGTNLDELERKVKGVTDWKQHFKTKPMTMLGVAFGGGILLATTLGGRRKKAPRRRTQFVQPHHRLLNSARGAIDQNHKAL